MADKKKGLAALIIASGKPKSAPESEPMEDVSPLRAAAEDVMEALEMKDAALLEESLSAFVDLCKHEEPVDEEME